MTTNVVSILKSKPKTTIVNYIFERFMDAGKRERALVYHSRYGLSPSRKQKPLAAGDLMFVLPTFDIFPLSYHSISGCHLSLVTSPERIKSLSFSMKSMERGIVATNRPRTKSATLKPSALA